MTTKNEKEVNVPGDNDKQISASSYARRLNQLVFPEYVYGREDHDEFCNDLMREREHALGKGIKDRDVADFFAFNMRKTSLRKSFMIALGKNHEPSSEMVIEAFQKCDKSKLDGDGYDRFKKMKPFEGEFHHDFVMRLAEQLDMQVPKRMICECTESRINCIKQYQKFHLF